MLTWPLLPRLTARSVMLTVTGWLPGLRTRIGACAIVDGHPVGDADRVGSTAGGSCAAGDLLAGGNITGVLRARESSVDSGAGARHRVAELAGTGPGHGGGLTRRHLR